MKKCLIILASALAGCATAAQNETTELGMFATDDGETIECRLERATGSRVAQRVCLTERQWEQIEDNSERIVDGRAGATTPLPRVQGRDPVTARGAAGGGAGSGGGPG